MSSTLASLLLITAASAILRLFCLNSAPTGLHFDDAVYGLMAHDIPRAIRRLDGSRVAVYWPQGVGQ